MALIPRTANPDIPPPAPLPSYLAAKGYQGEGRSLKLKRLLLRHKLTIAEMSRAIRKADGDPMSRPSLQNLITYGIALVKTPFADVRAQGEAWLREKGVPADQIATAFELEDEVVDLGAHPGATEGSRAIGAQLRAAGVAENVIESTLAAMRYDPVKRAARYAARSKPARPDPLVTPLEKTMLSPAAMKHFGLAEDPFTEEIHSADDIFRGADVNEARENLWRWSNGSALGALIGECGSGKTWLRQDLEDRIARSSEAVRLIRPPVINTGRLNDRLICESIIRELAPGSTIPASSVAQSSRVKDLLRESAKSGTRCVLIIEEGHKLTIPALRDLKVFYELQDGFRRLLSIILIAQPEMDELLNETAHPRAREVIRRVTKFYMKPMHANALKPFLSHKFSRAGVSADKVMDESAYTAILADRIKIDAKAKRQQNDCYPLAVQTLVSLAMNHAASIGAPLVTADIVAAAVKHGGRA